MYSAQKFFAYHCRCIREGKDDWRLGQRFCNWYIKGPWPELFYEDRDEKAATLIEQWLAANHYFDNLPVPVDW